MSMGSITVKVAMVAHWRAAVVVQRALIRPAKVEPAGPSGAVVAAVVTPALVGQTWLRVALPIRGLVAEAKTHAQAMLVAVAVAGQPWVARFSK